MSQTLLPALRRRFPDHAEALPALVELFEADEPLPFLFRYRVDALKGVEPRDVRRIRDAWRRERDLDRRRDAAKRALAELGDLPDDLAARIDSTRDEALLEDVVRPIRESRRARKNPSAGIEDPMTPVAREILLGQGEKTLEELLAPFCGEGDQGPSVDSQKQRLVRLVAEVLAANPLPRAQVRDELRRHGILRTKRSTRRSNGYDEVASLDQPLSSAKTTTLLLARRAQQHNVIDLTVALPDERRAELREGLFPIDPAHPHADLLKAAAADALDRLLLPAASGKVFLEAKRKVESRVLPRIRAGARDRLFAPPAGRVPVVAIVPGAGGSCRVTVLDADGNAGRTEALHPLPPRNEAEEAQRVLLELLGESDAKLIAVAGSRKARALRSWVEKVLNEARLDVVPVPVNETAAQALAKSESKADATGELPVSVRASVSVGRFLQDPLLEACRYDLTNLPLDQYQRDLDQGDVRRTLDEVVAEGLARVGVDVNRADRAVLARVPGLGEAEADAIVAHRTEHGPFATRAALRELEGVSEEAWQRAVGFLRVFDGPNPLDATGVHPTGEDIAKAVATARGSDVAALVGDITLRGLDVTPYAAGEVHTEADVSSVLDELQRPRTDPRGTFVPPVFNAGVRRLKDLEEGMELTGVVTNVSEYGAFVDVGLRTDGLVHVSELAHRFVKDPSQVVAVGERVQVKVLGIDPKRRRISLSRKALLPEPPPSERKQGGGPRGRGGGRGRGRGGPRGRRSGPASDIREIPKEHDPFHLQLAALRSQLGFSQPEGKSKDKRKKKSKSKARRKDTPSGEKPAAVTAQKPEADAQPASSAPAAPAADSDTGEAQADAKQNVAAQPAAVPKTSPAATSESSPATTPETPPAAAAADVAVEETSAPVAPTESDPAAETPAAETPVAEIQAAEATSVTEAAPVADDAEASEPVAPAAEEAKPAAEEATTAGAEEAAEAAPASAPAPETTEHTPDEAPSESSEPATAAPAADAAESDGTPVVTQSAADAPATEVAAIADPVTADEASDEGEPSPKA